MEDEDENIVCIECGRPGNEEHKLSKCHEKGKKALLYYSQHLGKEFSGLEEKFERGRLFCHEDCKTKLHNETRKILRQKHKGKISYDV